MLTLDGEEFASGVSTYLEEDPSLNSPEPSVHVRISVQGDVPIEALARLDPATPWVVLNSELNRRLRLPEDSLDIVELRTAIGLKRDFLERFPITLQAEQGDNLEVDATLFICDDWPGANFLGYRGFVQRIRFAVDPFNRKFYFGSPA